MYADAYLAQTDGAYSAACGRRVPSRRVPQAPSMTSGLLRRTGSRPCSCPAGSLSVLFFWECEVWWFAGKWWAISAALDGCGGLAVFVEGFLLTFAGGVVILKVHIWEHSGPFGYLIPIWLVV